MNKYVSLDTTFSFLLKTFLDCYDSIECFFQKIILLLELQKIVFEQKNDVIFSKKDVFTKKQKENLFLELCDEEEMVFYNKKRILIEINKKMEKIEEIIERVKQEVNKKENEILNPTCGLPKKEIFFFILKHGETCVKKIKKVLENERNVLKEKDSFTLLKNQNLFERIRTCLKLEQIYNNKHSRFCF